MSTLTVDIEQASIRTTVSIDNDEINNLVRVFLSNIRNENKIISLDTEQSVICGYSTVLSVLQLCDGDSCLIIPVRNVYMLPVSLINFLNLPDFTFVGVGIHKTLKRLEKEFCLTCKNAVEIGPSSWDLFNNVTDEKRRIVRHFVSIRKPTSAVFEDWYKVSLSESQIELAVANAYFAFKIGNLLMSRS